MIDTRADAGVTVVTICNYDKYQFGPGASDASFDAANDVPPTQTRRTQKYRAKEEEARLMAPLPAMRSKSGKKADTLFKAGNSP